MTNVFTRGLTTTVKNISESQKFPCACCRETPSTQPAPGNHGCAFCLHRWDFRGRNSSKRSHAAPLLYHFTSSPAINVSFGCFTFAPISLASLINFNSSSECPEVSLCGVVLFCFRDIEHAFLFSRFLLSYRLPTTSFPRMGENGKVAADSTFQGVVSRCGM